MKRTNAITSSAPINRFTGIQDTPGPVITPRAPQYPLHNPLNFIFTKKGTTKKIVPNAAERLAIYGEESFEERSPYYNNFTKMSNLLTSVANMHSLIRIKPSDAPAPANVTIYMDVLKTRVKKYKRNSDGGFATDALGDLIEDGEIDGAYIKYFAKHFPEGMKTGSQKSITGVMVDANDNSIKSTMYPIMDIPAKEFGEFYSNLGITISPVIGSKLQPNFAKVGKFLPYEISILERKNKNSTGKVKLTLRDSATTMVSFKKDAIHPYTDGILDVDLLFPHNWYDESENAKSIKYYDIDNIHFYYDNLDMILKSFLALEKEHLSYDAVEWADGVESSTIDWFDFTSNNPEDEQHLINWITLKSSNKEVNYISLQKNNEVLTAPDNMVEITLGSDSALYLMGGGDGTISDEEATKFIDSYTEDYLNPDHRVTNLITNHETSIYDIGLDLPTKKMLGRILAVRPDTIVHWATHLMSYGDNPMSSDEEMDLAIALLATAELYPESELYNTPVCRATIMMGSYEDINSRSKNRYTQNFEIARIFGEYMGSAEGKMLSSKSLDETRENTVLKLGRNYTPEYISDTFKKNAWGLGVTYSEDYTNNTKAILSVKSVHQNEQSVLTNPVLLYLNARIVRIMDLAHKKFAGDTKSTNEVFANRLIKFMNKELEGVIDSNRFEVNFSVVFEAPEIGERRYAYKVFADVGARLAKTAQISTVRTYLL